MVTRRRAAPNSGRKFCCASTENLEEIAPYRLSMPPLDFAGNAPLLTFRRIDLARDGKLAAANHLAACMATYGDPARYEGERNYLNRLRQEIEEYPDGCVLAWLGERCVGQLELQVPYGSERGYVNLFIVTEPFRRRGFGRRLNEYAERYFRAWEASLVELHVSPTNHAAVSFYRAIGYRVVRDDGALWKMAKTLVRTASSTGG